MTRQSLLALAEAAAAAAGFVALLCCSAWLVAPVLAQDLGTGGLLLRGGGAVEAVGPPVDPSKAIQLSVKPKVYMYDGFLSNEECDYLVLLAKPKLQPAVGSPLGTATFLRKYQDTIVRRVEDRLTAWLLPPREKPEALKVMRYNEGQKFDVHYEFFPDNTDSNTVGARAATVILFLSDVDKGGEIVFPKAEVDDARRAFQQSQGDVNDCNKDGLSVRPKKGSALLFFHLVPDGSEDPSVEHRECGVAVGEKWSASKWLAVQKYSQRRDPNVCQNEHPSCDNWAAHGECKANPSYMIGDAGNYGKCRLACKVCTPKAPKEDTVTAVA